VAQIYGECSSPFVFDIEFVSLNNDSFHLAAIDVFRLRDGAGCALA
jgi:hypothetical protein